MRIFTEEEKKKESFLRIANVLYSHWRISTHEEKQKLMCGGHSRLFDALIYEGYIIKGESVKGQGHREHIVPCVLIRDKSYEMFNNGFLIEDVASMIEKNLIIIHITKEERKELDKIYKTCMPDGWKFGDNPYLRLEKMGIQIKMYN